MRLLLAYGPGRRPEPHQAMSRVPVLLQEVGRLGSCLTGNTTLLAIRLLGTQLGGTPQDSCRWVQSHIRGDRQVHEVD